MVTMSRLHFYFQDKINKIYISEDKSNDTITEVNIQSRHPMTPHPWLPPDVTSPKGTQAIMAVINSNGIFRYQSMNKCLAVRYITRNKHVRSKKARFSRTQYPVRLTAQSALHFTHWQTCWFRHQLAVSGKRSSHAAVTRKDYSLTFPPQPSIARYSFI